MQLNQVDFYKKQFNFYTRLKILIKSRYPYMMPSPISEIRNFKIAIDYFVKIKELICN